MPNGGDSIDTLPVDSSNYNKDIANVLFKEQSTVNTVFSEMKESLFIVLLFAIFSSKAVDDFIIRFYPPAGNSPTVLFVIKSFMVIFFFYMFKNFSFARTS